MLLLNRRQAYLAIALCCAVHGLTGCGMRSGQVLADRAKRQQRRQEIVGVRSSGNFIVRLVQEGLLRTGYAFSDHTRNALILAIFGFKVIPLPSGQSNGFA